MEQLNIFKGLSTEFSSKIRKAFLYNEGVNAVFVHYNDDVFEVDDKFNITKLDSLCQSGISNIAPGCGHCIALTNSGDVFAWGYNNVYQCGNGTNDNVNTPSLIKVKKVIQIASYGFHTLVLTNEGHVYAWGANESGQCGMDQCVGVEFPKMVIVEDLNTKVVSIGCGTLFSMVVLNNGNIYGWGDNNFGQLGLGMKTRFETKPRLIESLEEITIKKIACGMGHVIALSNNGTIYSWGINEYGQLGIGNKEDQNTPQKIELPLLQITEIAVINDMSGALTDNGKCFVWGKCKDKSFTVPTEVEYKSINEAFLMYSKCTLNFMEIHHYERNMENKSNEMNMELVCERDKNRILEAKFNTLKDELRKAEEIKLILYHDHNFKLAVIKTLQTQLAEEKLKTSIGLQTNVSNDMLLAYNMNHKNRGKCIIFYHLEFNDRLKLAKLEGNKKDSDAMEVCFKNLGFDVMGFENPTRDDIHSILESVSNELHTDNDCIIISVLTHGNEDMLYAYDTDYPRNSLFSYFKGDRCLTLAGKPKIFIIQACRGDEADRGVTIPTNVDNIHGDNDKRIPTQADFLIINSTAPGNVAFSNPITGSYFIQTLVLMIKKYSENCDFMTILTMINNTVAYQFESNNKDQIDNHKKKQMPCTTTMLTRLIFFKPKSPLEGLTQ